MGIDDIRGNFVNFYENGLKSGVCSNVNNDCHDFLTITL